MNPRNVTCLVVLVSALAVSGCSPSSSSSSSGGVAIVDLDRIATAMGWMDDLSKNLQAADTELKSQLDQVLRATLKAIEDVKQQVATDAKLTPDQIKLLNSIQDPRELSQLPLSKEQKDKLVEVVGQANNTWQQALNGYQQALQQRRAALIMGYREKVRPYVRRVAESRGITVVYTTSENIIYAESSRADITDAVIDQIQKNPPPRTTATPATTTP
jgi:Skp family chaperone for outer membrane proteins